MRTVLHEALKWLVAATIMLAVMLLSQGCTVTVIIGSGKSTSTQRTTAVASRFVEAIGTNQTSLTSEGGGGNGARAAASLTP